MFAEGYASAYRSLQQPREGTILSAMYSFKEGFQQTLAKSLGLEDASRTALRFLQEAVEQSITILPEQRALRAPDAGAMAFYYFAEAFLLSLLGKAQRRNRWPSPSRTCPQRRASVLKRKARPSAFAPRRWWSYRTTRRSASS